MRNINHMDPTLFYVFLKNEIQSLRYTSILYNINEESFCRVMYLVIITCYKIGTTQVDFLIHKSGIISKF
jgi:hypothetical protein